MWNVVIGGVMIVGGLSGKLSLIGTGSPAALAIAGFAVGGYGVFQILRARKQ